MANKAKSLIPIVLDKKRNLLYDGNTMIAIEEATGKNVFQGDFYNNLSAKDFRALIWACLLHEDKELTLEQVGHMLHPGNLEDIANAITKVLEAAMPEGGKLNDGK